MMEDEPRLGLFIYNMQNVERLVFQLASRQNVAAGISELEDWMLQMMFC